FFVGVCLGFFPS
ncbi:hypothetical protein EE612_038192, partial [Oryza sativa]